MKQLEDLLNFCCITLVRIIEIVPVIMHNAPKTPKKSISTSRNKYCRIKEKNTPVVLSLKNKKLVF